MKEYANENKEEQGNETGNPETYEFRHRLIKVRRFLGIMQKDFAKELGLSVSFISQVESGKTKPGFTFFKRIIEAYYINPVYLITGKGEIFLDKATGDALSGSEYGGDSERVDRMLNYINQSPQVKFAILEFFNRYVFENRELISEDIKEHRELKRRRDLKK